MPAGKLRTPAILAAVFAATFTLARLSFTRFPALFDVDSYYHLALARLYGEQGFVKTLDWARFSVMHDALGDKELLFHVLLIPFARAGDATSGGLTALALLDASVATVLAWAGLSAIGPWGVALPLLVFGGSMDFASRMVRLRPEIVALVLIVLAIGCAARRRFLLLGLIAAIFALTYTPFHALLGLCALFFVRTWWVEGGREWWLVLAPAIGAGVGLALHPHFPDNLRIWWIQNVTFFIERASFDASAENAPRTSVDLLLLNLGWLIGLIVLWLGRERRHPPAYARERDCTAIAAAVFALLYVSSARFVTYFVPLATLTVVRSMQVAGEVPGRRIAVGGLRVPFGPLFSVCLLWGVVALPLLFRMMEAATPTAFRPDSRDDWERFAAAVPRGARVFASWQATEPFVFFAPEASYVNVLDSVFLLAKDPELYARSRDVLAGREPDVPLVVGGRFASDYFADDGGSPMARERLRADPRVRHLHDGITALDELAQTGNGAFVLDWKLLPEGTPLPASAEAILAAPGTSYPRAADARERALEGYVDGRRLSPAATAAGCVSFAHVEDVDRATRFALEVSPYGSADVYVDDALVAALPSARLAVLGNGVVVPVTWQPGRHRIVVRTCRSGDQLGFYALRRS